MKVVIHLTNQNLNLFSMSDTGFAMPVLRINRLYILSSSAKQEVIEEQNESAESSMMMTTEPQRKKRYMCKAAKEIDLKVLKIQFAGFIAPLNKQILDPHAFQGEERDFS